MTALASTPEEEEPVASDAAPVQSASSQLGAVEELRAEVTGWVSEVTSDIAGLIAEVRAELSGEVQQALQRMEQAEQRAQAAEQLVQGVGEQLQSEIDDLRAKVQDPLSNSCTKGFQETIATDFAQLQIQIDELRSKFEESPMGSAGAAKEEPGPVATQEDVQTIICDLQSLQSQIDELNLKKEETTATEGVMQVPASSSEATTASELQELRSQVEELRLKSLEPAPASPALEQVIYEFQQLHIQVQDLHSKSQEPVKGELQTLGNELRVLQSQVGDLSAKSEESTAGVVLQAMASDVKLLQGQVEDLRSKAQPEVSPSIVNDVKQLRDQLNDLCVNSEQLAHVAPLQKQVEDLRRITEGRPSPEDLQTLVTDIQSLRGRVENLGSMPVDPISRGDLRDIISDFQQLRLELDTLRSAGEAAPREDLRLLAAELQDVRSKVDTLAPGDMLRASAGDTQQLQSQIEDLREKTEDMRSCWRASVGDVQQLQKTIEALRLKTEAETSPRADLQVIVRDLAQLQDQVEEIRLKSPSSGGAGDLQAVLSDHHQQLQNQIDELCSKAVLNDHQQRLQQQIDELRSKARDSQAQVQEPAAGVMDILAQCRQDISELKQDLGNVSSQVHVQEPAAGVMDILAQCRQDISELKQDLCTVSSQVHLQEPAAGVMDVLAQCRQDISELKQDLCTVEELPNRVSAVELASAKAAQAAETSTLAAQRAEETVKSLSEAMESMSEALSGIAVDVNGVSRTCDVQQRHLEQIAAQLLLAEENVRRVDAQVSSLRCEMVRPRCLTAIEEGVSKAVNLSQAAMKMSEGIQEILAERVKERADGSLEDLRSHVLALDVRSRAQRKLKEEHDCTASPTSVPALAEEAGPSEVPAAGPAPEEQTETMATVMLPTPGSADASLLGTSRRSDGTEWPSVLCVLGRGQSQGLQTQGASQSGGSVKLSRGLSPIRHGSTVPAPCSSACPQLGQQSPLVPASAAPLVRDTSKAVSSGSASVSASAGAVTAGQSIVAVAAGAVTSGPSFVASAGAVTSGQSIVATAVGAVSPMVPSLNAATPMAATSALLKKERRDSLSAPAIPLQLPYTQQQDSTLQVPYTQQQEPVQASLNPLNPMSDSYLVDNSQLKSSSPGLQFCNSKRLEDCDWSGSLALWGSFITGAYAGDGWLQVSDGRFLPMAVNGVFVLIPKKIPHSGASDSSGSNGPGSHGSSVNSSAASSASSSSAGLNSQGCSPKKAPVVAAPHIHPPGATAVIRHSTPSAAMQMQGFTGGPSMMKLGSPSPMLNSVHKAAHGGISPLKPRIASRSPVRPRLADPGLSALTATGGVSAGPAGSPTPPAAQKAPTPPQPQAPLGCGLGITRVHSPVSRARIQAPTPQAAAPALGQPQPQLQVQGSLVMPMQQGSALIRTAQPMPFKGVGRSPRGSLAAPIPEGLEGLKSP